MAERVISYPVMYCDKPFFNSLSLYDEMSKGIIQLGSCFFVGDLSILEKELKKERRGGGKMEVGLLSSSSGSHDKDTCAVLFFLFSIKLEIY